MLKRLVFICYGLILSLFLDTTAQAFSISQWLFDHSANSIAPSNIDNIQVRSILNATTGLDPRVLSLGLQAYNKLHLQGYDTQQVLTIVDYSKPSTQPRLWVINLKDLQVPVQTLVAHGENSGGNMATSFSDAPTSLKSSIGVYLTGNTYIGKHGYSLRLNGLEPGFNSNAAAREIVIHAANYVSTAFASIHGRLGRSWGCMAVNPAISNTLISQIKDGTVVFAYYPDQNWLHHSTYFQV